MTRTVRLSAVLLLGAAAAFSQGQAVPSAPVVPPVAPAANGDGRIALDVVVHDKSGNPVSDLEQRDFTILDNKQPQPVLSFEAVRAAEAGTKVILVIDEVNVGFQAVSYGREQIKKFLRQDGGKLARPLAIDILTDSGLTVENQASLDGNALAAYLDQHPAGLRVIRRSQGIYGAGDRANLSIAALGQLAEREEKEPGRKLVLWVSPGWALLTGPRIELSGKQQEGIFESVVALSARLRQARIALYAVDPLGTADAGRIRTFYYEQFLKGVRSPGQAQFADLALQVLAVQSGGRVLNSNNDIAAELRNCLRDANSYYVLSYAAPGADGPNEYHEIEVKLDQPQWKAQARTGYYAQPVRPHTP